MATFAEKITADLMVPPGQQIDLRRDYDPGYTDRLVSKQVAQALLVDGIERLAEQQEKLYAQKMPCLSTCRQWTRPGKTAQSST